jgi:hypothetical protein
LEAENGGWSIFLPPVAEACGLCRKTTEFLKVSLMQGMWILGCRALQVNKLKCVVLPH